LPSNLKALIVNAISQGISIVNGLHYCLSDDKELSDLAFRFKVRLHDIRKPKSFSDLHFWNGSIKTVKCPIVAVLGTDCKMGKRTTAKIMTDVSSEAGIDAQMIYTGQTGYLQGFKHGFIFDATLNDFIAGELEKAVVDCYNETNPDVIFIEGQSALRNPNGPCGSEFIISANAKFVVLQHSPDRIYFDNDPALGYKIPSLRSEIDLINSFGGRVVAISLKSEKLNTHTDHAEVYEVSEKLKIPVINPLNSDHKTILSIVKKILAAYEN